MVINVRFDSYGILRFRAPAVNIVGLPREGPAGGTLSLSEKFLRQPHSALGYPRNLWDVVGTSRLERRKSSVRFELERQP
jgi:hypothetical protein